MGNAAIDYEKLDALEEARMQPPRAEHFNVSQNGHADNYSQENKDGNYRDNESRLNNARIQDMNKQNIHDSLKNKGGNLENYLPHEIKEKLDNARQDYQDAKKLGGEAKTLAKSIAPWEFFSLIGKMHFLTDIPYFLAIMAALLKDGLDLVGVGSLPGIGTAITTCDSFFTMAMMFLGNVMHKEHDRTIFQSILLKQVGVLIFTTIIEFIFGIDLAPFQTVGVVFIYAFALAARKGRDEVVNENM